MWISEGWGRSTNVTGLWPWKIIELSYLWICLYSLNRGQMEKFTFSFLFVHGEGGGFIFVLFLLIFYTHIYTKIVLEAVCSVSPCRCIMVKLPTALLSLCWVTVRVSIETRSRFVNTVGVGKGRESTFYRFRIWKFGLRVPKTYKQWRVNNTNIRQTSRCGTTSCCFCPMESKLYIRRVEAGGAGGEHINTSASWRWGEPRGWGTRQGKDNRSVLTACRRATATKDYWLDR